MPLFFRRCERTVRPCRPASSATAPLVNVRTWRYQRIVTTGRCALERFAPPVSLVKDRPVATQRPARPGDHRLHASGSLSDVAYFSFRARTVRPKRWLAIGDLAALRSPLSSARARSLQASSHLEASCLSATRRPQNRLPVGDSFS